MLDRLHRLFRPKPVQMVRLNNETVVATWGLNLMSVAAALDAQAEGAADLAAQILRQRKTRNARRTAQQEQS
jgi:hypothetical protein